MKISASGITNFLVFLVICTFGVLNRSMPHVQAEDLITFPPHTVLDVRWSPDGQRIARVFADGTLQILAGDTQQILFEHDSQLDLNLADAQISWTSDGRLLAAGIGQFVYVWDTRTDQLVNTFETGDSSAIYNGEFWSAPEGVVSLTWSHDNSMLAVLSVSVRLTIWTLSSGNALYDRIVGNVPVPIVWLPDDTGIRSSDTLFDIQSQQSRLTARTLDIGLPSAAILSRSGALTLIGTVFGYVEITDTVSGSRLALFRYTNALIMDASWSLDDSQVLTVNGNGEVRLINLASGDSQVITQIDGQLFAVDINPINQQIVIGGVTSDQASIFQVIDVPMFSTPIPILEPTAAFTDANLVAGDPPV